jgi:hypothetical protein
MLHVMLAALDSGAPQNREKMSLEDPVTEFKQKYGYGALCWSWL